MVIMTSFFENMVICFRLGLLSENRAEYKNAI